MPKNKSLRWRLQLRLVLPLILFIVCESILSYFVTLHYVDKTYDRWLLDSASSLAQEIKVSHAKVLVELPGPALEIVRWDDLDKTYFKINSVKKGLMAGDSFVPEPVTTKNWPSPVFFTAEVNNDAVRVVSMRVERPDLDDTFFIHVAETLKKRHAMMVDILLADLIPQLVMVVLVSDLLVIGLSKGLRPLKMLTEEIAKRSPSDLSPIADANVLSEVKTLTDTTNALLTRLSSTIAGQQRFIANAAHQLRTPLAGLVLQAERALREHEPDRIKPAVLQMQTSAKRLSRTVNQLLVLAQSEPCGTTNEFKPVNLHNLVKTTCIEAAAEAMQHGIEIGLDADDSRVTVMGDEHLLREMLTNLLDNSISYGKRNGQINVALKNISRPTLTIEDDGPGIADAEMKQVFDRFYRIPGSSGEGSGLGLAIVKEIADLHCAHIELYRVSVEGGTGIKIIF